MSNDWVYAGDDRASSWRLATIAGVQPAGRAAFDSGLLHARAVDDAACRYPAFPLARALVVWMVADALCCLGGEVGLLVQRMTRDSVEIPDLAE